MLHPLPRETVFEARRQTRRRSRLLIVLLVALYVVFFNILVFVVGIALGIGLGSRDIYAMEPLWRYLREHFWTVNLVLSLFGGLLALLHYHIARSRPLPTLLCDVGAMRADPRDTYHQQFINIVHEAEAATGIRPILPMVLSGTGCNAFSLADGDGRCAIGITEGALARLNRDELSAVVAHEAAHLVHEDSALATTVGSLTGVFSSVSEGLKGAMEGSTGRMRYGYGYGRGRGAGGVGAILIVWLVATLQSALLGLLSTAISRGREYLADAHAVQMCKDPLALAEALYKISTRYRGVLTRGNSYASLFILNPNATARFESEDWFANLVSTHPPLGERLRRLLNWGRSDFDTMVQNVVAESHPAEPPAAPTHELPRMYGQKDGQWIGPHTPMQLLTLGLLHPGAWIMTPEKEMKRAREYLPLVPLLEERVEGTVVEKRCPRCNVRLARMQYEGAPILQCAFCEGHLLLGGTLERIVLRRDRGFAREDVDAAVAWHESAKGRLELPAGYPHVKCPLCGSRMSASFHSLLTKVVVDRCVSPDCGAVWCDKNELETIQILVEQAPRLGKKPGTVTRFGPQPPREQGT